MDEDRLSSAVLIILKPWLYKVCEGCDSILKESSCICPSCKSYRFDLNEDNIIEMANKLANSEQKTVTDKDLY